MPGNQVLLEKFDESTAPAESMSETDKRQWAISVVTELTDTRGVPPDLVARHLIGNAALILDFVDGHIDRTGLRVPRPAPVVEISTALN